MPFKIPGVSREILPLKMEIRNFEKKVALKRNEKATIFSKLQIPIGRGEFFLKRP